MIIWPISPVRFLEHTVSSTASQQECCYQYLREVPSTLFRIILPGIAVEVVYSSQTAKGPDTDSKVGDTGRDSCR